MDNHVEEDLSICQRVLKLLYFLFAELNLLFVAVYLHLLNVAS